MSVGETMWKADTREVEQRPFRQATVKDSDVDLRDSYAHLAPMVVDAYWLLKGGQSEEALNALSQCLLYMRNVRERSMMLCCEIPEDEV